MKYNKFFKKKSGFTLIEIQVYIFISTLIIAETIHLSTIMYKSYINSSLLTNSYNNIQNFNLSIDKIIKEENAAYIEFSNDQIRFLKHIRESNKKNNNFPNKEIKKLIKLKNNNVVVEYDDRKNFNYMLEKVEKLEVKEKGKLIYLIIYDMNGEKFITCL